MPKTKATLSQDDLDALAIRHLTRLRAQDGEVSKAKAVVAAAQAIMTDLYHEAKVDGFTRKELAEILVDSRARHRDLAKEEERRAWLRRIAGLPAGTQLELFDERTPTLVRDEQFWRADGYQAGLRGDEAKPPEECDTTFVQPWMAGWGDGQSVLGQKLARAEEIIAARGPQPDADEVDLNGDGDDEKAPDLEPATIDAKARKVRKSAFMDRTPADAEPEQAAA